MKIKITYEKDNRFVPDHPYWAKTMLENGKYFACCGETWAHAKARLMQQLSDESEFVPQPEEITI